MLISGPDVLPGISILEKNPTVVKELGDVGNDIQIYRGRIYAVINCSHKVEVMDAATGVRIRQFDIPNCRYIRFKGNFAYVSSYVAPVMIDPAAPQGAVYRIDLRSNKIVSKAVVGFQPEELEISGNYIFVANSGDTGPRTTTRPSRSSTTPVSNRCPRFRSPSTCIG